MSLSLKPVFAKRHRSNPILFSIAALLLCNVCLLSYNRVQAQPPTYEPQNSEYSQVGNTYYIHHEYDVDGDEMVAEFNVTYPSTWSLINLPQTATLTGSAVSGVTYSIEFVHYPSSSYYKMRLVVDSESDPLQEGWLYCDFIIVDDIGD